jgi:uncharacterized protein (DUF2147 family)
MRAAIGWRAAPFGFVAVVCLSGSVLRGQEASAAGRWRTIDDKTGQAKSIVRIIETNGVLEGRVEQVFSPPSPSAAPLCEKCSGDLKNKPIVGMTIMWDMKKDGAEYGGGRVLDPEEGKTYRGKVRVIDGGRKLELRGYVGIAMFGRTQTWSRESS